MDEQLKWELIQAALDGEELDRITDRAAHYLGSPLVVISTTSNIIAHSASLTPPDETWLHAVERGIYHPGICGDPGGLGQAQGPRHPV